MNLLKWWHVRKTPWNGSNIWAQLVTKRRWDMLMCHSVKGMSQKSWLHDYQWDFNDSLLRICHPIEAIGWSVFDRHLPSHDSVILRTDLSASTVILVMMRQVWWTGDGSARYSSQSDGLLFHLYGREGGKNEFRIDDRIDIHAPTTSGIHGSSRRFDWVVVRQHLEHCTTWAHIFCKMHL